MKPMAFTFTVLLFLAVNIQAQNIQVTTYAEGIESPWGMVFLPSGELLVTEKAAHLRLINAQGEVSPAH